MPGWQRNLHAIEIPFSDAVEYRNSGVQLAQVAVCEASERGLFRCNLILFDHFSANAVSCRGRGQALRSNFPGFDDTAREGLALLRPRLKVY